MHTARPRDPSATDGSDPSARIVADVGGSHITAAAVALEPDARVLRRESATIDPHASADDILITITDALRAVSHADRRVTVALPGPFDYERGMGTFDGVAKFAALSGVDLRRELSGRLGMPPQAVTFVNDAVAYGVGEWWVSATRPDRFACITLGTGIGSAFLHRGRAVESGPDVPPHGWAHLLTIDGAPLEDSVSTRAIVRRFAEAGGGEASTRQIAELARSGDGRARHVLDNAFTELGAALGPWFDRFAASEVVVGGSMARSWDVLGAAFIGGLRAVGCSTLARASELLDDAPLIGAAVRG